MFIQHDALLLLLLTGDSALGCPAKFLAAMNVFFMSMATVIGPTPP